MLDIYLNLFDMSIDQRIKYLIALSCDGKQRAFAKKINTSPQVINNLLNRKTAPSFKLIQQILREFPKLNPYWLILGEGEIGKISTYIDKNKNSQPMVMEPQANYDSPRVNTALFKQKIASLEREVELLEKIIQEKEILIAHLQSKT